MTSSFGDNALTASVFLGSDVSGDVLVGPPGSNGRYTNYLQSTLTQSRNFPTDENDYVLVFSIPSKLFGDYIQPESFVLNLNYDGEDCTFDTEITDDGNGNLISGSVVCGQIFYPHGIAVLTQQDWNQVLDLSNAYHVLILLVHFQVHIQSMKHNISVLLMKVNLIFPKTQV